MKLGKILHIDSLRTDLKGTNKLEIIEELVDVICSNAPSLNKEIILESVQDREEQMSTGMNNGVAIPHGKTDSVSDLYVAVGVSEREIEFESLDQKPSRIFVMTISPASHTGLHLQFLAEVSRLLISEDARIRILACKSRENLLKILLEKEK